MQLKSGSHGVLVEDQHLHPAVVGGQLQRGGVHCRRERLLLPRGQRRYPLGLQPAVLPRGARLLLRLLRRRRRGRRLDQPGGAGRQCLRRQEHCNMSCDFRCIYAVRLLTVLPGQELSGVPMAMPLAEYRDQIDRS